MQNQTQAAIFALCLAAGPALAADHLPLPKQGPVTVEFAVSENANVMDLAGAWETFQDAHDGQGFRLLIVSDKKGPVHMTGGMVLMADYSYDDAPAADLVSIGAQKGSPAQVAWLKARHAAGAILMSVCTGAFRLAATGLLDGKSATTHHDFFAQFHARFPRVTLSPGDRYVRSDRNIFTAGGLTSGIDLALHMVALYYGEADARKTARYMEYTGTGWLVPTGASPTSD